MEKSMAEIYCIPDAQNDDAVKAIVDLVKKLSLVHNTTMDAAALSVLVASCFEYRYDGVAAPAILRDLANRMDASTH